MIKTVFSYFIFILLNYTVHGQEKTHFELTGEGGLSIGSKVLGFGLDGKLLLGKKEFSRITLAAGFSSFVNYKNAESPATTIIPILIGYQRIFKNIVIEPQIGFGALNGKIVSDQDFTGESVAALILTINAGYKWNQFIAGVKFKAARGIEKESSWYNHRFCYTAIYASFRF